MRLGNVYHNIVACSALGVDMLSCDGEMFTIDCVGVYHEFKQCVR